MATHDALGAHARAGVIFAVSLGLGGSGCFSLLGAILYQDPGRLILEHPDVPAPLSQWDYKQIEKALGAKCELVDENGVGSFPLEGCYGAAGGGKMNPAVHTVRLVAQCQPESILKIDVPAGKEVTAKLPWKLPAPTRRFLGKPADARTYLLSGDARWPTGRGTVLPPGTEVTVVTQWPDGAGKCTLAIVEIVDAAGAMAPKTVAFIPTDVFVAERPAGPTPAEWLEQAEENNRAAEAQKVEKAKAAQAKREKAAEEAKKVSAQETKSGRCTPERNAYFQRVLSNLKPMMDAAELTYMTHIITAAGSGVLRDRVGLPGDYHIIAMGYEKLGLDVRGADGQAAAMSSPYAGIVSNLTDTSIDSRVLQATALEKYSVKVNGSGCALVAVFLHH